MAKKAKSRIILAKLYSQAGTGYIYYFRRPRTAPKMALRKYDPVVRAHVLFNENKPPSLPEITPEYRETHQIDKNLLDDDLSLKRSSYLALYRKLNASSKLNGPLNVPSKVPSIFSTSAAPIHEL